MATNNNLIGRIIPINRTITLDEKNRRIISMLTDDARLPYSTLAKSVKLSKSNVARRISLLEKQGLITGYNAFIDVSKLGIQTCIILLQVKMTEEEKYKFMKKTASNPLVYSVDEFTGRFSIIIGFYYKNENHRNSLIEQLLPLEVKDFLFFNIETIFPKLDYTADLFSRNHLDKRESHANDKDIKIDQTDLSILQLLSTNCRISSVDMGEKLKISRETVNYRIRKLVQNGIITKFQPAINLFLLGFEAYALFIKFSRPTQKEEIINYLSKTERCNTILKGESCYDLIALIHFKSNKELREFEKDFVLKFEKDIFEYSFENFKYQEKLDWFPDGIAKK